MFNQYNYLVTIDELCKMLNIGKNTAYKLLEEEELRVFKIGRIWKIPKGSVKGYILINCNAN